ncbi:MAG: 2-polyprenyl-6-hydroxyphenyl methylase/3-demethylubiquinone-9 3-methyltransferase [Gammaproteobacteria bacterium]|jgi:2-polyprenyl-6-hydroxyphenyl methylase/3-demethylubiquinone-9 3-methyltransferase
MSDLNPPPMSADAENVDPAEIAKFEALAERWWDPGGEFRPLHQINPLRLDFIDQRIPGGLQGKRILDVGCGGGILAEAMALRGAIVTAIDLAPAPLAVAQLHARTSQANVTYRHVSAETLARELSEHFDVVTCLEMLEHVPDPGSIVNACRQLARSEGSVFFSTINRNAKAYALAIIGAEYVLNLLPRGTHDYEKFIRPSELDALARQAGLTLTDTTGMHYDPFRQRYRLGPGLDVNYLTAYIRPAELHA